MNKLTRNDNSGFTIIELLVTLFVAAIFLIAGYQIYITVIRVDGQTKAQVVAQNTAEDYLNRYRALVPSPCVASQPLNNQAVTVSGLANATIAVTVSCPKSNSISTLSKIDVVLKYGNQNPQQQVAYSAWSYSQDVCGQGWILVPGNSQLGTPNFCVMKYEAKNVNGVATSQAAGAPWVNISWNDAVMAAASACATCHLISEAEWMTLANNVASTSTNWSGGAVGSGYIYRGHSDNDPASNQSASTDDINGYYGTNNSQSSGADQRRTLVLSNGEIIWDFAGNVWEQTNATLGRQQPGLSSDTGFSWKEWNNSSLLWGDLPSISRPSSISSQAGNWSTANGIGGLYSNYANNTIAVFNRGGARDNVLNTGILSLAMAYNATFIHSEIGFRVAKSIDNQPEQFPQPSSCPSGFIPVPGNSYLGTVGFCVMKYEAKNVGGAATSRPDGSPWANLNPGSAITAATSACSGCHILSESEWMTIAANVLSVPNNWSGGVVGSGYIYSGHSDNAPANTLIASTDDNNGYYGETNAGGNQRRTLELTNGEVIWDFAGNVWEWVNATLGSGQQPGLSGDSSYAWREWTIPNMVTNGLPITSQPIGLKFVSGLSSVGSWNSTQGIGTIYSGSGETAVHYIERGGGFNNGANSGLLALALIAASDYTNAAVGFRVAK